MACFVQRAVRSLVSLVNNESLRELRWLVALPYSTATTTTAAGSLSRVGRQGCSAATADTKTMEFYGARRQVKASPQKMNLVAKLIRGMKIKDALAQLEFSPKRAATYIHSTVLDTQRRAVSTYGVDPLNLYVAESYVGKGTYLKRIRYHGRGQHGIMHKVYAHYFLILREGPPPIKKKKSKEDHKKYLTRKLIHRGPLSIPNSL